MDRERLRLQTQAAQADRAADQANAELMRRRDEAVNPAQRAALDQQIEQNRAMGAERVRQLGAADAQLGADRQRLEMNDRLLRNLELQRNAMAEGNGLRIQLRSAEEQFSDELTRIEALRRRGAITDETAGRATFEAQNRLLQTEQASTRPASSLSQGSAAALNAINAYRRPVESREERVQRVLEQTRQIQAEMRDIQQRQLALIQAGRVLAALRPGGI